jgi:thiamine biosynthesis lipoprotein
MKEYIAEARLMGSAFQFIINAASESAGKELLQDCIAEVSRIEKLLTEFSESSDTGKINKHAGISEAEVSSETCQLLQRCLHISKLTAGSFDITSGILKKLYQFRNTKAEMPAQEKIAECIEKTGYKKIRLSSDNKVYLKKKGMHIGFGAIGKGYAADKTKKLMQQKGVAGGVINASGDLCAWGTKPDGSPWKAGIADPDNPDEIILWLPLNGLSIATSGNYEQYFESDGTRYSHNIDPRTGMPVTGIKSVTVLSPAAELSDALATAVTVMGVHDGLHLINQLPQTHCIIFDEENRMHCSKKIERATFNKHLAV